jgi:hypothetical protein
MKQQVMESENLCKLQMCQGLIPLIFQSLKLNIVKIINPKTKTKNMERNNLFVTQRWRSHQQ